MPELSIAIGGKTFEVACQPGEEEFLHAAAAMLDAEAAPVVEQMGRMTDSRMLLMAGLMLADRMAGVDEEIRRLREQVAELEARPAPEPERIEVPVIPEGVKEALAELAARAEAMAERVEERARA
ncbi:cell division protein ZapA [Cereibacter azotoformans]|uniref:Cell division protein ZapA n=2 Tax=Cereibacter TaxID=1653176 RepID=A0A2T5JWQ6_9RHOB|nr:cell division protein ZapA [Cereibacter azotoformans]AXQ93014.1 cell division protein ZapA [Cereibacter sphaeroides]MBO4169295.1 cell division protein ZapA [Cereibacter azotoformans]PTR14604.1 cell division protein ZapA [Cereibacter azotoformans]UIJ31316.1 cell division protein ZapA [Cereibacter azotoformans]ULB09106.1 cell division protein ZapA [Cereibacter azotoformans]